MAKKKAKFEVTPIMSLSILALFALMIPVFSTFNTQKTVRRSSAAAPIVVTTPTPSPTPAN